MAVGRRRGVEVSSATIGGTSNIDAESAAGPGTATAAAAATAAVGVLGGHAVSLLAKKSSGP